MKLKMLLTGNDFGFYRLTVERVDFGEALVNAAGFDSRVNDGQALADADDRGEDKEGILEGEVQIAVGGVHKEIASRL